MENIVGFGALNLDLIYEDESLGCCLKFSIFLNSFLLFYGHRNIPVHLT